MSCDSLSGTKYFITFINDYNRKKFVYFLKNKSEALIVFKKFKVYAENQTERKIEAIRTDNGREYIHRKFSDFLREQNIVHQKTVSYSPQQTGLMPNALIEV